jgi:short subunit fatty acids transporter
VQKNHPNWAFAFWALAPFALAMALFLAVALVLAVAIHPLVHVPRRLAAQIETHAGDPW